MSTGSAWPYIARSAWLYIGAATWLAAVCLSLLGGCGAGAGGGNDHGGGSSLSGGGASATAGAVTTSVRATAVVTTTTAPAAGVSAPSTSLGVRSTSPVALSAEIRSLLGENGVPVYLPRALPPGYDVAAVPSGGQGQDRGNPAAWHLAGTSPGLRAAGYRVLYTDGSHRIRLDVNPAGDLGDVRWVDADVSGVYGPLRTTTAAGTTWVGVADPDGVEIVVSGDTGISATLLLLASTVARVEAD